MNDSVIHLDGVKKVFLTDEVETHALAGIDLEIKRGQYISISGPSGCASNGDRGWLAGRFRDAVV